MSRARPIRGWPVRAAASAAARSGAYPAAIPAVLVTALATLSCDAVVDGGGTLHVDELPPLAYTEEVRIGSRDDPDVGFSRIGGMKRSDDGTLYVLEYQVPEIRVYDPEGRWLRTVGGPGEGPGEFSPLITAFGLVGDTLWVTDPLHQRISWFGPDGSLVHETPITPLPVETDVTGMSLSVAPSTLRPDGLLGSQPTTMMGGGAADRPFSFPVVRFDRDGRVMDTVRWDTEDRGPVVRVGGRAIHPPVLLPRSPILVEEGEGRLELDWEVPAPGGDGVLEVVRITAEGDTLGQSALRYEPVPLPGAVRDSLVDRPEGTGARYGVSDAELEAAMASGLELPDHRPPLRRAKRGGDGSLWIELNGESTDSTDWVVLDPELTPRGRATLPLSTAPELIDGTTVWAVETDELEVPWLVRLRVE